MDPFVCRTHAQEIIFAPGALAQLGEVAARSGWQRLSLYASHSMQAAGYIDSLGSILGDRLTAVYGAVRPHVQDTQVKEAVELAIKNDVDAVIGLGGGSPIGMAKAVVSRLNEARSGHSPGTVLQAGEASVPVIAIPTTYSGSEMTPVYGITHTGEDPPRKVTINDPLIVPRLVLYDPQLTLDLPPELTASTGINALAHCIEALYSKTRNPLSTAAAKEGVKHICKSLLQCYQDGRNLKARSEMLLGSYLAGTSLASVTMGLHHGLCHVLGGSAKVPHGIANAIVLPHAIRFNADATAVQLLPAADAMELPGNGNEPKDRMDALAEEISRLIDRMNLPRRLRDVGVNKSDLPDLACIAFHNRTVQNNPKPILEVDQLEQLLGDAW